MPNLTFVLPHWLYWSGLVIVPLMAMFFLRRAGGKDLSGKEIEIIAKDLAIGIHNSIVHWSPDVVVLGGSVPIDVPEIVGLIEKEASSLMRIFPEIPPFKRTELEDEAGLWGALRLSQT